MHSETATVRRFMRAGFVGLVAALLLAALALAPPVASVRAATDTVTTCANSGAGSLPAVLAAAGAGDTITFAQDCTGANAITLTSTLTISKNVTIDATVGGRTVTISGNNTVQLFVVNRGITLGLAGLTLTGGYVGNVGNGGAIDNQGTLTVTGSTFTGNSTLNEGGAIL